MPHQHLPILFVDDDPISHRVIQSFFKDWEVTHVYSGKEALGALREKNIMIVITDLVMPGMHGLELLEEIKKAYGNRIKVVVVTVSDDEEHLLAALDGGATDFLLKPIKKRDLDEVLEQLVSRMNRWRTAMATLSKKREMKTRQTPGL